jgi:hypothetical protein
MAIGGAALALMLAPAVLGTSWVKLTMPQLVGHSEVIAVGTITSKVAEEIAVPWFQDAEGDMIYTRYELTVSDAIKGVPAGEKKVSFVSMGGQIGRRAVDIPGAPHFEVGDKVLGFFFRNNIDRLQPHWGGINMIVQTRRGEVVVGEASYTIEQNVALADAGRVTRQEVEIQSRPR